MALTISLSSIWRPDCPLSDREKQILEAIVEGHSSRVIARDLVLSIKTISNHRTNLMRKLNVRSVVKLVRAYDTWTTLSVNERAELEGLRALRQRYDHIMGFISMPYS